MYRRRRADDQKYVKGDWSLMINLRQADGSCTQVPQAFVEGHFPEGTFKVRRRSVRYLNGVGYPGFAYTLALREAEVAMVLAAMR